jgi:hypothetical protein
MGGRKSKRRSSQRGGGQDLFQAVGVEGTFTRVCKVFAKQWCVFLGINFITSLVSFCTVLVTFVVIAALFVETQMNNNNNGGDGYDVLVMAMVPSILLELLIIMLIQYVAEAATVQAVAEVYAGHIPSIGSCLCKAFGKLCSILCSGFIVGFFFILVPGGLVAYTIVENPKNYALLALFGVVYAFFVGAALLLTYHVSSAIMVEHNGPINALVRSMRVVTDNFCYTFCSVLLWLVTKFLINSLVTSLTNSGRNPANITNDNGSFQVDLTFGSAGDGALAFVVGIFTSAIGSMYVKYCDGAEL